MKDGGEAAALSMPRAQGSHHLTKEMLHSFKTTLLEDAVDRGRIGNGFGRAGAAHCSRGRD